MTTNPKQTHRTATRHRSNARTSHPCSLRTHRGAGKDRSKDRGARGPFRPPGARCLALTTAGQQHTQDPSATSQAARCSLCSIPSASPPPPPYRQTSDPTSASTTPKLTVAFNPPFQRNEGLSPNPIIPPRSPSRDTLTPVAAVALLKAFLSSRDPPQSHINSSFSA